MNYINGETLSPLLIFPEGTVSSGKHLLKFKKGAFANLLPIKPVIVKSLDKDFDLSTGGYLQGPHYLRTLGYLYHKYEIVELPTIYPTEFMYKRFEEGKMQQWEMYAETVRDIYSEIGGFKNSEMTLLDNIEYNNILFDKK